MFYNVLQKQSIEHTCKTLIVIVVNTKTKEENIILS